MVKYVYYDFPTKQVAALFDTPNLSVQKSWQDRGYSRALVPDGLDVTRDHKIAGITQDGFIINVVPFVNPDQPRQ